MGVVVEVYNGGHGGEYKGGTMAEVLEKYMFSIANGEDDFSLRLVDAMVKSIHNA